MGYAHATSSRNRRLAVRRTAYQYGRYVAKDDAPQRQSQHIPNSNDIRQIQRCPFIQSLATGPREVVRCCRWERHHAVPPG